MDIIINFRLPKYITNHTKPIMFVCEVIAWILIAKLFYYIYQQMQIIFVGNLDIKDVKETFYLGMLTCLRVFMLIVIASLIWVPVGVYIGLRPKLASKVQFLLQFLSSFPANLYFPVFVIIITKYNLNPTIWLCPLMLIGAQYYILFNVIAGTQSIPNELAEASSVFKLKGWLKWKHFILKAIMPHYLSGAITAAGGAWNASIISEIVNWGDTTISMPGLGAYIVNSTNANNSYKIALGIIVMIIYVVTLNKIFWRPIQKRASEKLRINL